MMMMGPLHIEMAFLNTLGDWLEGSGWTDVLLKTNINTPGRIEAFLSGSQVKRSRCAYIISCAGLHLLLKDSYTKSGTDLSLKDWIALKKIQSVNFNYWITVFEMETMLMLLVKSLRISDFEMFVDSVEKLIPWFFVLDIKNCGSSFHLKKTSGGCQFINTLPLWVQMYAMLSYFGTHLQNVTQFLRSVAVVKRQLGIYGRTSLELQLHSPGK